MSGFGRTAREIGILGSGRENVSFLVFGLVVSCSLYLRNGRKITTLTMKAI